MSPSSTSLELLPPSLRNISSTHPVLFARTRGKSMYPLIRPGDIVAIQPLSVDKIQPFDIVCFRRAFSPEWVLHRFLGIMHFNLESGFRRNDKAEKLMERGRDHSREPVSSPLAGEGCHSRGGGNLVLYPTEMNFQFGEAPHPTPPPKRERETTENPRLLGIYPTSAREEGAGLIENQPSEEGAFLMTFSDRALTLDVPVPLHHLIGKLSCVVRQQQVFSLPSLSRTRRIRLLIFFWLKWFVRLGVRTKRRVNHFLHPHSFPRPVRPLRLLLAEFIKSTRIVVRLLLSFLA